MRSINIPSINIPRFKIFSGFSFPPNFTNTTWTMIVFIIGMFLLSCMSNRCITIDNFENNGKTFEAKPWYSCKMKSNCLPGEIDSGDYCLTEGCPSGMVRGTDRGEEMCFPECPPDYDQYNNQCLKICPEGYFTEKNRCIRPKHEFIKDVVSCRITPPKVPQVPQVPQVQKVSIIENEINFPVTHNHSTFGDRKKIIHSHQTMKSLTYEPFKGNYCSVSHQNDQNIDSCQTNKVSMIENMNGGQNKDTYRIDDRIYVDELPCPLGYTQSGQQECVENCPSTYMDTGESCVLDRYSVERPSFSIGQGIPHATKRPKYKNIDPVAQCN